MLERKKEQIYFRRLYANYNWNAQKVHFNLYYWQIILNIITLCESTNISTNYFNSILKLCPFVA